MKILNLICQLLIYLFKSVVCFTAFSISLPGLVVVLRVDQLRVGSEHQLDLGGRPLRAASQRRSRAPAVRLGPRAVVRGSLPLVARPGLRGGLTAGVGGV